MNAEIPKELDISEGIEKMFTYIKRMETIKKWDNKQLLWSLKKMGIEENIEVFGALDMIWGELEERLYPEFDGDKITWEEWGWNTPEGEIKYLTDSEIYFEKLNKHECG